MRGFFLPRHYTNIFKTQHGLHRREYETKNDEQHTPKPRFPGSAYRMQNVFPWPQSSDPVYHGRVNAGQPFTFRFCVSPPFGADHAIALVSPAGTQRLNSRLLELDGQKAAGVLRHELRSLLKDIPAQVGTIGLFTKRGEENRSC